MDSVAEALVPMLVAGLRDRSGTDAGGFLVLVTLALMGAAAVSCLPRVSFPSLVRFFTSSAVLLDFRLLYR
jgi:hypothetical protein